ncbi:type II toxin-antitoxin system death-on-curing family toxin [Treponema primitia]|uniref:type II toxin-antitoxin system death-on-curing family toxin n=1 Tax=Treponema primitia TaxID=88058 RepID=UPI0039805192
MKRISTDQIIEIHKRLIGQSGGAEGIRDINLLDSAVRSPFQTFGGIDLYPNLYAKASQMGYQLINNHPFLDGNKRIGIHVLFLFLRINGEVIDAADDEKISLGLGIARGDLKPEDVYRWLETHSRPYQFL